jgi:hypothetical protein
MLSVVADQPTFVDWFVTEFIQISGYKSTSSPLYFLAFRPDAAKQCPFVLKQVIDIETIEPIFGSIENFLTVMLSLNHYIEAVYNMAFVSNTVAFKRNHANHQILIHGYDLATSKLQVAEFFRGWKYKFEEADIAELARGMQDTHRVQSYLDERQTVLTYKLNDYRHVFSSSRARRNIDDFLSSEDRAQGALERTASENLGCSYGLAVYEDFSHTLLDNNYFRTSLTSFNALHDHSVVLLMAAKFFLDGGLLLVDAARWFLERCTEIEQLASATRGLFLKHQLGDRSHSAEFFAGRVLEQGERTKSALIAVKDLLRDGQGQKGGAIGFTAKRPYDVM